jgi:hypothetical protein
VARASRNLSGWSRPRSRERVALAVATWAAPRSSQTYGFLDLDITEAEPWCAARAGVSIVHVVGAAAGRAIAAVPDANSYVLLGRIRRRESVDVSYVVDVGKGRSLSAVCVRNADRKPPRAQAGEVLAGTRRLRRGVDPEFGRIRRLATWLPPIVRRQVLSAGAFVTSGLGIPVPPASVSAHPFGSVMLSSVGAFGLERGLAPLVPAARTSMVLLLGAPTWRPRIVDGEVVARRIIELGITMDHRLLDGAQVGDLAARLRADVERPWEAWEAPTGSG